MRQSTVGKISPEVFVPHRERRLVMNNSRACAVIGSVPMTAVRVVMFLPQTRHGHATMRRFYYFIAIISDGSRDHFQCRGVLRWT